MIRKYYDKILLAIALVVLLAIFAYAAFRPGSQPITEFIDIPSIRPENTYEVSEMPEVDLSVARWEAPPAQSAGPEWVFDVFTPPVIHFDPAEEIFIIEGEKVEPGPPFGIELVTVRQENYRIQLIGWVGRADEYLINLEDLETGELILAREGREYADLDIVVRSFSIENELVEHAGGTEVRQDVARAVIYDQRLEREITLRSEVEKKDDEATATFEPTEGPAQEFRAREGNSFTLDRFTYTVDSLSPPSSATVTRTDETGATEPETKTLVAREGREGDAEAAQEEAEGASAEDSAEENPDLDF